MKNDAFVKFYLETRFGALDRDLLALDRIVADLGKLQAFAETNRVYNAMQFNHILQKGDLTMGALTELATALTDIGAAQANIAADIKSLQAHIAAGGTITEAQLQPFASQATAFATSLKALAASVPDDATTTPPPPNPDPGP